MAVKESKKATKARRTKGLRKAKKLAGGKALTPMRDTNLCNVAKLRA